VTLTVHLPPRLSWSPTRHDLVRDHFACPLCRAEMGEECRRIRRTEKRPGPRQALHQGRVDMARRASQRYV